VPVEKAVEDSDEFRKASRGKVIVQDPVARHTIDLFDPPAAWRGMLASRQFFAE
jgi:hypothetical protein